VSGPLKIKRGSAVTRVSHSRRSEKTSATAEASSKKGHFYKPLPKEFRRDGFNYRQIAREGDGVVYAQSWNRCCDPAVCFEVIRVRRRDGFQIGGRFVAPAEVYPRREQWGELGWTFCNKEAAFAKLREITATTGGGA
jgi:hypothetical protein